MAHQDQEYGDSASHASDLHEVLDWLTSGLSASVLGLRAACTWRPKTLTFAALLWAWSDEKTLLERFVVARKIIIDRSVGQRQPAGSYQAFVKLLRRWTAPLRQMLSDAFRQRMTQSLASVWSVEGWPVFAVDGSKVAVPRTRNNEACYSPQSKLSRAAQRGSCRARRRWSPQAARQRKANVPRIWLTMLWHVGSGLPWDWRTGPADSSERQHLEEMLAVMPTGALLAADAGFVGYDLWNKVLASGHQLLVRVGSNVKLLKKLGYVRESNGMVYLWPDRQAKQLLPPLVLRMAVVFHQQRGPVYLLTSLLKPAELSDRQLAAVYRRRWGIEVYYRHCKQTFERGKLRSHRPDHAMLELHWSLLGMWAMGLHAHTRLVDHGVPPQRISFAGVWRAHRRAMREYKSRPDPGERLGDLIDQAIIDPYPRRRKNSRHYPRQKREQLAGPPRVVLATRTQVHLAQQIKLAQRKRLTA